MAVHSTLNAFSFDVPLIEIGQEIKLLEHLKKNLITLYIFFRKRDLFSKYFRAPLGSSLPRSEFGIREF
jgi:hypothetical protein